MLCETCSRLQQDNGVDKVSHETIGIEDFQTNAPIEKESSHSHLNQIAPEGDEKILEGFEGQPLQMLERDLKGDTMEVEEDASSKTCRVSREGSKENLAQDLGVEVNVDGSLSSIQKTNANHNSELVWTNLKVMLAKVQQNGELKVST